MPFRVQTFELIKMKFVKGNPKVVGYRVDASIKIGTGHVMRCLTLANDLKENGVASHFVCRAHIGHMAEKIKSEGHGITLLPVDQEFVNNADTNSSSKYESWLGADWLKDAEGTVNAIAEFMPVWLVVDHYAINAKWERIVKAEAGVKIMLISGMTNQEHVCDLLLDQTYSSEGERRWDGLVPRSCELLVGPKFALLRPEFIAARRKLRQRECNIRRIFIAFGGVDEPNATSVALDAVLELGRTGIAVDIVIGRANPNRAQLQSKCQLLIEVSLHIEPTNIAELMLNADLAISGGGAMLLEQCYLHLPSIVVSIADNQIKPAQSLHGIGAVIYVGDLGETSKEHISESILKLTNDMTQLKKIQSILEELMEEPETHSSQVLLK